jgi:hypothetical protein
MCTPLWEACLGVMQLYASGTIAFIGCDSKSLYSSKPKT